MLRNCLIVLASVLASASATPIEGSFDLNPYTSFVDVFGTNFNYTWTFHQGDGFFSLQNVRLPDLYGRWR